MKNKKHSNALILLLAVIAILCFEVGLMWFGLGPVGPAIMAVGVVFLVIAFVKGKTLQDKKQKSDDDEASKW